MRDYGKVAPSFWTGDTGRRLRSDPDAQRIALYLMTGPHSTMSGVFYCPAMYIAHEVGLTLEGASEGLRRLSEAGFCVYDEASEWVFVVEMARYQIGDALSPSDNRVKGIRAEVPKMPEGVIRQAFIDRYGTAFNLGEVASVSRLRARGFEGASEPLRSQEQEKEQKREEVEAASGDASAHPDEAPPTSPPPRSTKRGGRLPDDWQPSPENLAYAEAQGFTATETGRMAERFRNHFHSAAGQKGVKLDWGATWRNWVLSDADRHGRSPPAPSAASTANREMAELRKLDPPDWPPGIAPCEFVRRSYVAGKWLGAWGPEPDSSGCRLTAEQRRDMLVSRFGPDEARRHVPGLFAAAA